MEEAGEGDLQRQFDALKKRLADEGLFADRNKQSIPAYPQRIGVISSATGAALQDIKQVLQRRSPHVSITLYPVLVQGDEAAKQIAKAIEQACYEAVCDVLIVSRGGGSLEDLWAFNEEIVVRAIAASHLPIISGIGHEIDFTMADFVADVRAPTPSVAAELAAPDRDELLLKIKAYRNALEQHMRIKLSRSQEQLEWLSVRLKQQRVEYRLQQYHQRLDELAERQKKILNRELIKHQQVLAHLTQRLLLCSPQKKLVQQEVHLNQLKKALVQHVDTALKQSSGQLAELSGRLNAVSPLATLQRGYSLVKKQDELVQSVKQIASGDELEIVVSDGKINCVVS